MSNTDDNLRKQIRDVMQEYKLDPTVAGGTYYINRVMTLINQDREAREAEHLKIYSWLLGLRGDFPVPITGRLYGWRSILRSKLPKYILFNINKLTSPPDSKAKA
jgi:hypothetical protein